MEILDKVLGNSGPLGGCLIFLWILSTSVIIERAVFWIFLRMRRNTDYEAKIMKYVKDGKLGEARKLADKSGDIFVRVFKNLLPDIPPTKEMDTVMSNAMDREFGRSHSFLRILNACAVIAPSLGFAGHYLWTYQGLWDYEQNS